MENNWNKIDFGNASVYGRLNHTMYKIYCWWKVALEKDLTCSKGLREAIGKHSPLAPARLAIGAWLGSYIEILHRRGGHGGQCAVYGLSLTGTWGDMATLIRRRAGGTDSTRGKRGGTYMARKPPGVEE